jgi:hypothetical protein
MAMMGGMLSAVMSILPMMMMMGMMKAPPPAPPPPPPPAPPVDPADPEGEMDAEVSRQRLIQRQKEEDQDDLLGLKTRSKLADGSSTTGTNTSSTQQTKTLLDE